MRLWIDSDIGDNPDDAIAIAAAAAHPMVELVGISTVGSEVDRRAALARDLLRSLQAPDVLIYAGVPDPRALAAAEAVLAIGPLTNLCALVRRGIELPPIAVMGGVLQPPVQHRGRDVHVDYNFAADPLSAAFVVHGSADLLLVPLDVTAQLTLRDHEVAALVRTAPALRGEIERWQRATVEPICLHDPCALFALLGEHVVIGPRTIAVQADGGLTLNADGAAVDVVVAADRGDIVEHAAALVGDRG